MPDERGGFPCTSEYPIFERRNMIELEILQSEGFATTQWSGGTTTELFIFPPGASYAERRFEARISTALVELETSVFTRLEGVRRFLTPLCEGGFRLSINGGEETPLAVGEVLSFSGEDDIVCRGSGRDLNLMLKGREGEMRFIGAGEVFTVPDARFAFIYAVDDTLIGEHLPEADDDEDEDPFVLCGGDFARVYGTGAAYASGRAVLFTVL